MTITFKITYERDYEQILDIVVDGKVVGGLSLQLPESEDDEMIYVERIDVDEEYRGQGIGTAVLEKLADESDIYFAPDNEDSQRLFERIAREFTCYSNPDHPGHYVDQGFGVYMM